MADQVIPLDNSPNQSFNVGLDIDGKLVQLALEIGFNEMAGYWAMDVYDSRGNLLLSQVPLLTGFYPAANILEQYEYLGIGSAFVINVSNLQEDYPSLQNNTNLGSDFVLLWSDTPSV